MNAQETKAVLTGNVVAVPPTIWKKVGVLDIEGNVRNTEFLFGSNISTAVYAGGVGEHDRLSVEQQKELLTAVCEAARSKVEDPCVGSGLGRTLERVKEMAPIFGELGIAFAMTMPPDINDQEEQFEYYSDVIRILADHGVGPMLYARPEHPLAALTLERLMDVGEVPGVKLAHNGLLLAYAEMVSRLGHERSAWLCGTAGWWMPTYASVGAARGMSTGIGNAFPGVPLELLRKINDGSFAPDETFWNVVKIEQIRQRDKSYIALVIKKLQAMVGLVGGMNGDGKELPEDVEREVEGIVNEACWVSG